MMIIRHRNRSRKDRQRVITRKPNIIVINIILMDESSVNETRECVVVHPVTLQ